MLFIINTKIILNLLTNAIDAISDKDEKDVHKGTGLGLAISKEIIEKHQGHFYYDDQSMNTRFVIEIPNAAA